MHYLKRRFYQIGKLSEFKKKKVLIQFLLKQVELSGLLIKCRECVINIKLLIRKIDMKIDLFVEKNNTVGKEIYKILFLLIKVLNLRYIPIPFFNFRLTILKLNRVESKFIFYIKS